MVSNIIKVIDITTKIIVILSVFDYGFFQDWKPLLNTAVYIIKVKWESNIFNHLQSRH